VVPEKEAVGDALQRSDDDDDDLVKVEIPAEEDEQSLVLTFFPMYLTILEANRYLQAHSCPMRLTFATRHSYIPRISFPRAVVCAAKSSP
jgi:hypothetical protein